MITIEICVCEIEMLGMFINIKNIVLCVLDRGVIFHV